MSKKTILTGLGLCLIAATAGYFIFKKKAVTVATKIAIGPDTVNFAEGGGDQPEEEEEAAGPGKKKRRSVSPKRDMSNLGGSIMSGISRWDKKISNIFR